jgi:hypothetical protein
MLPTHVFRRTTLPLVLVTIALAAAPDSLAAPVRVVDVKKADAGDKVTLFKNVDFRVRGECVDNGGGDFTADSYVTARRNNLRFDSYNGDPFDADFDRNDSAADITVSEATGTDPALDAADFYEFYGEGKAGAPLNGRIATSVHLRGADCTFSGTFVGGPGDGPAAAKKRKEADAGEKVTLFSNADFKVTGECVDNGGGDFRANTFIAAKRRNLVLFPTEVDNYADPDFDPSDGKVDFIHSVYEASGTTPAYSAESYTNDLWAEGKGGTVLQARIGTGVHTQGADCTFSGIFLGPGSANALHMVKRIAADAGDAVTIYQTEDFRVTGRCVDNGAGNFTADTFLAAQRGNLAAYAYDGDPEDILDFDPADGKVDITSNDATGPDPDYKSYDDYSDFYGLGKGTETLVGRVGTGVHIGNADCTFAGMFLG